MKLIRLRIVGFKSFVEPVDVVIEPGLTGVVGPNGCGKSNLVEALRWVMGETSHKNLRASGMDEVIFAGSNARPARNTAEVTLTIDNADRLAPAAFNDTEMLEVSRRIERQHGSSYAVNGRETRARDIQLLFADAATGARSPALVRQGQIAELIAAKPQQRRRILEDAAGIAGLRARRHEAELRLKHAEDNLVRVEDVLREIEAQADSLRRQGRQAARYRTLSAEIRRLEALLATLAYRAARDELAAAEADQAEAVRTVADRTAEQAETARAQAVAAHGLEPLRQAEVAAAAALRRLSEARTELDHEERRSRERLAELERRLAELERDAARQEQNGQDAARSLAQLEAEAGELATLEQDLVARRDALAAAAAAAEARAGDADAALTALVMERSDRTARREALERNRGAERERAVRAEAEAERVRREIATLEAAGSATELAALRERLAAAEAALRDAEDAAGQARTAVAAAREAETRERALAIEADREAGRAETEHRTLAKLFVSGPGARGGRLLDTIEVTPGLETALAAALGDDLEASTDPEATLRWLDSGPGRDDPALPEGAAPLFADVEGGDVMSRRLRQVGLVDRSEGLRLAAALRPGQRLVSREGDLWRWDGLAASAEAPSAAARRLAERNRLAGLEAAATEARARAEERRAALDAVLKTTRDAAIGESAAAEAGRRARRAFDEARDALGRAERREAESTARLAALADTLQRLDQESATARERSAEAEREVADLAEDPRLEARHGEARTAAAEARAAFAESRAALGAAAREADLTARRRATLADEVPRWRERVEAAATAADELAERRLGADAERQALVDMPDAFVLRRRALTAEIEAAEIRRSETADAFAGGQRALAEADRMARAALEILSSARERRAAADARADALRERLAAMTRQVAETFGTDPVGLLALAGWRDDAAIDAAEEEARLAALRLDRERLGAVNLRAEDELTEAEDKRGKLAAERDDLVEAIKRLRQAISSLNRDGRERLRAAFGTVDAHFRRLFTTLFGGGEAALELVDSDDPLEAGLEIIAKPPGKKPQSLTLLSGGEQALTATALIFAVFLTNPSPVCVLDEVDAPLDDANVERYCDLLREMSAETETRFVVITHNPVTMARMDRLFGVTMAERGVSQLVSVDLEAAERLREAV